MSLLTAYFYSQKVSVCELVDRLFLFSKSLWALRLLILFFKSLNRSPWEPHGLSRAWVGFNCIDDQSVFFATVPLPCYNDVLRNFANRQVYFDKLKRCHTTTRYQMDFVFAASLNNSQNIYLCSVKKIELSELHNSLVFAGRVGHEKHCASQARIGGRGVPIQIEK